MEKDFEYDNKETYSPEEVKEIISQHKGYLKIDDIVQENEKLKGEVAPYKTKERNSHIKTFLPKNFKQGDTAFSDFLKVIEITEDDDDDVIKTKIKDGIKSREYFLESNEIKTPGQKEIIGEKQKPKIRRFLR